MNIAASDRQRLRNIILSLPSKQNHAAPLTSEFDDRAVSNVPKSTINRKHKMILVRNQPLVEKEQIKKEVLKTKIKDYLRQSLKQSEILEKRPKRVSHSDLRDNYKNKSSSKLFQKPLFNSVRAKSELMGNLERKESQFSVEKVLSSLCFIGACEISKESPKKSPNFRKRVYNSPNIVRIGAQSSVLSERRQKLAFSQRQSKVNNPEHQFQSIEPWRNQQDGQSEEPFYSRKQLLPK